MKVHTQDTKQEFQPKSLTIEIESQEEYDMMHRLFSHNITVPDALYPNSASKAEKLEKLMSQIFYSLTGSN